MSRGPTEHVRQQLRKHLVAKTEDGPYRSKSRHIARKIEDTSPKQVGHLISKLADEDGDLEIEAIAYSSGTTWEVRRS